MGMAFSLERVASVLCLSYCSYCLFRVLQLTDVKHQEDRRLDYSDKVYIKNEEPQKC